MIDAYMYQACPQGPEDMQIVCGCLPTISSSGPEEDRPLGFIAARNHDHFIKIFINKTHKFNSIKLKLCTYFIFVQYNIINALILFSNNILLLHICYFLAIILIFVVGNQLFLLRTSNFWLRTSNFQRFGCPRTTQKLVDFLKPDMYTWAPIYTSIRLN